MSKSFPYYLQLFRFGWQTRNVSAKCGTPRGKEEGSMFNQKKKKMITALNSPKYKLSIDDMRTIAGGKK